MSASPLAPTPRKNTRPAAPALEEPTAAVEAKPRPTDAPSSVLTATPKVSRAPHVTPSAAVVSKTPVSSDPKNKGGRPVVRSHAKAGHAVNDAITSLTREEIDARRERANFAKREAERVRAEALLAVADGSLSVVDVLTRATTAAGKPLLRLRLDHVLMAQPRFSAERSAALLAEYRRRLRTTRPDECMALAWVLSGVGKGRRLAHLAELLQPVTVPAGFPYRTKASEER